MKNPRMPDHFSNQCLCWELDHSESWHVFTLNTLFARLDIGWWLRNCLWRGWLSIESPACNFQISMIALLPWKPGVMVVVGLVWSEGRPVESLQWRIVGASETYLHANTSETVRHTPVITIQWHSSLLIQQCWSRAQFTAEAELRAHSWKHRVPPPHQSLRLREKLWFGRMTVSEGGMISQTRTHQFSSWKKTVDKRDID